MGLCLPEGHPQAGEIFFLFLFLLFNYSCLHFLPSLSSRRSETTRGWACHRDRVFGQLSKCAEASTGAGSPNGTLPVTSWNRSTRTRAGSRQEGKGPRLASPPYGMTLTTRVGCTASRQLGRQGLTWNRVLGREREKGPEGQAQDALLLPWTPTRAWHSQASPCCPPCSYSTLGIVSPGGPSQPASSAPRPEPASAGRVLLGLQRRLTLAREVGRQALAQEEVSSSAQRSQQ